MSENKNLMGDPPMHLRKKLFVMKLMSVFGRV